MFSRIKKIEMPHVFTLLVTVIFIISLLSYIIPSGSFEREEKVIDGKKRTVVVPGTYKHFEKEITLRGIFIGDESPGKVTPVSITDFLSAIPILESLFSGFRL